MYCTRKTFIKFFISALATIVFFISCTTVKKAPIDKPFIYNTEITVNGNLIKDEKKRLTADLENYWDDSLKIPKLQKLWFFYVIKNPPIFDERNIIRTKKLMSGYLNSQGYYYAIIKDSVPKFDTIIGHLGLWNKIFHPSKIIPDQIRATVLMNIQPGKNVTIDSTAYTLLDSTMQKIADYNKTKSLLKKGTVFSKQNISNELDRLTNLYRDKGYYKFSRDDLFALTDTTDTQLLPLTLDPIELNKLIAEAAKNKRENPKWDIVIKQKPFKDSSKLNQYFVAKTYFYPETKLSDIPDSLITQSNFKEEKSKNIIMRYKAGKFVSRPLKEYTYLHNGNLYNETDFYKTLNSLSRIGAWQQTDARIIPTNKDSLNLYYFLVPSVKQNFSVDLEGSRNTGDFTAGSLFGISTNFTYRNRNVWKQAIQSVTNLRIGTELSFISNTDTISNSLLQSFQVTLSHTYIFPKLIQPFKNWSYLNNLNNKRTLFSVSGTYYDRKDYYRLRSFVGSWGYEWSKNTAGWAWAYKPLNIELYKVDTLTGLINAFVSYPFLRNSIRNGNVVGSNIQLSRVFVGKKNVNNSYSVRFYAEESGLLLSLFSKINDQIFDYAKFESEFIFSHKQKKSELAARFFAGAGIPTSGKSIPAFKQYFLGGPNSMRAWNLRQLGLGSSIASDTINPTGYTDRFGDMALEANIEYRFIIWNFSSVKIGSALFADMGNIWNIKADPTNPNASFDLSRLGKDLAIGVGTGLRFDLSYFLLRFDFGYKLKDPARQYNDGWADLRNLKWVEKRFNGVEVNNWAFQFGINLPF